MNEPANHDQQPQPARREFMRVALTLGFGAAAVGAGLYTMAVETPVSASGVALPLMALEDVGKGALRNLAKADSWVAVDITLTRRDAYKLRSRAQRVYVKRVKDGDAADCFAALSPVCPHAGCSVDLVQGGTEPGHFHCPCHSANYDVKGEKQSGPAPRGLDPLALTVGDHDGRRFLMVEWRDYLPGSAERKER